MKEDKKLQPAVVEALQRGELEVPISQVEVTVCGGAVRLGGLVQTCFDKYAAERAALGVPGVRAISQEMRLVAAKRDDRNWAIAEEVSQALESAADVPATVQATVESGWVTLQGEVESAAQREAAEEVI